MKIEFTPIGTVHSPFSDPAGMPIQPTGGQGITGTIELIASYQAGLQDLEGFSHIILLYLFHRSCGFELSVIPYMDTQPRGLFATRAPRRPNPIGFSVVRLEKIEAGILHIRDVDILDGSPLLDIKPYVPAFDAPEASRIGWLEKTSQMVFEKKSDDRFT